MPVLCKTEVMDILTRQISKEHKRFPINIQLYLDWDFIQYDKKKREWYFDTVVREHKYILKYKDGYSFRFLTSEAVVGLILKEYPDAKSIHIDIRIKDDNMLLKTKTINEVIEHMSLSVSIEFDNEMLPTKEDLQHLIDLALDMGNEQMFMEYAAQYNAYY